VSELKQAIIRTGGKQYRVQPGTVLKVEKLAREVGATFTIDDVLLVGSGESVTVGTPRVAGAAVQAEVVSHGRGQKLIVYKYRKRQSSRTKQGHRQDYTELKIVGISAGA
jgi:large subunit ribosomal protein L21